MTFAQVKHFAITSLTRNNGSEEIALENCIMHQFMPLDKVQEREKERLNFLVKQCKINVLHEHHENVRQKVRRFHQSVESFKKEQGFNNSAPAKCRQYNWAIKVY